VVGIYYEYSKGRYNAMKNLKHYRKASDLSQKQLAELLEVDQSYISRLENNKVDCLLSFAVKASNVLKTDLYKLVQK
jgi:predicted transcriptional regulator